MKPEKTLTKTIKQQIIETGMCRIQYPAHIRSEVLKAIEIWKKFCALPESKRISFPYFDGVGYELKNKAGATLDRKEDLHVTLAQFDELENAAKEVGPEAIALVHASKLLIDAIAPLVAEFAFAIESGFSLPGFSEEVIGESQKQWWLRYLHYFGDRKIGDEIATSHVDKSGFTLHLFESDEGLQFLDIKTRSWVNAPVMIENTIIFPGMRTQFRSEGNIKALCHRVIATDKTAITGRFSMVCFIPLTKTKAYNKAAAGRLQEMQPGFNYDMPVEDFAKLFA